MVLAMETLVNEMVLQDASRAIHCITAEMVHRLNVSFIITCTKVEWNSFLAHRSEDYCHAQV